MNDQLTAQGRCHDLPNRCQIIFLACFIVMLGAAVWRSTAKYQLVYRDLDIEGTLYNTIFRILGTPATLAVAVILAVAAVIASRRLSLAALGWFSFALSASTTVFFAAFVAFFFLALRYPAVSMAR